MFGFALVNPLNSALMNIWLGQGGSATGVSADMLTVREREGGRGPGRGQFGQDL